MKDIQQIVITTQSFLPPEELNINFL